MRFPKLVALVAVASLASAACGGSSAATTGVAPTAAPGGNTAAPTSAPVAATATPAAPVGGATPAPAAVAAQLCGLLTVADLKTAMGADYGAGVPDDYGECTWRVGGATVNNGDGQLIAAIQYMQLSYVKSSFSGGTDATVGGHAAYWNGASGLQSLWVDVGSGRMLVLSFDPVTNDTQAAAQQLAGVMITKM